MNDDLKPSDIPDGKYYGLWGGNELRWIYGDRRVSVETELGRRGFDVRVEFYVKNGKVDEESIVESE